MTSPRDHVDDLFRHQDACLIAITDGKPLPSSAIAALPPWRAVLLARVGAKAGAKLEHGTLDQLVAEAQRVGGNGLLRWPPAPPLEFTIDALDGERVLGSADGPLPLLIEVAPGTLTAVRVWHPGRTEPTTYAVPAQSYVQPGTFEVTGGVDRVAAPAPHDCTRTHEGPACALHLPEELHP